MAQTPKDLEKVGVYGYVTYDNSGESVLANNPDLSTDAGQFAMIETVSTKDKSLQFEFIAAIPKTRVNIFRERWRFFFANVKSKARHLLPTQDVSQFENGIGKLQFESLRIISFPGGQQVGSAGRGKLQRS